MTFQKLITDLIKAGFTQKELADEAGCSQANIARLLKQPESEPKYSVGQVLVELHEEYV